MPGGTEMTSDEIENSVIRRQCLRGSNNRGAAGRPRLIFCLLLPNLVLLFQQGSDRLFRLTAGLF